MRSIIALSLLVAGAAQADNEIACWNMYDSRNSPPILRATIEGDSVLSNIQIDLKNAWFNHYKTDRKEEIISGEEKLEKHTISRIEQPLASSYTPELLAQGESAFEGNHAYRFEVGSYSSKSPVSNVEGVYQAQLILPMDISRRGLADYKINSAVEESNGVLLLDHPIGSELAADAYLRLYCTSTLERIQMLATSTPN